MADRTIVLAQNKRHAVRGVTVVNPQEFSAYQEDDDDLTYIVDMSSYLDGATISSVTRTPTGVTVSNTSNTTTRLTQRLKGFGYVDINVTSSSGEVEQFRITIQPRGNSSFFLSSTGNVPQNTAQMWGVVADVTAANIDSGISWIRTQGYYIVGDGGGALYKRVYSVPSHGAYITSNTASSYWEFAEPQLDVRQAGAKGDGTTDDTAAVQLALNSGFPVVVSAGVYKITAKLTRSNEPLTIRGESDDTSIFSFTAGTGGIEWSSTSVFDALHLRDLTLRADGTITGPAVSCSFEDELGLVNIQFAAENIFIHSNSGSWANGFYLFNARNASISECNVTGTYGTTGYCYKLDGNSLDARIDKCQGASATNFLHVSGTCEGTMVANCLAINCDKGIYSDHAAGEPGLYVSATHFNVRTHAFDLTNSMQVQIDNCLLYAYTGATMPGFTGFALAGGDSKDVKLINNIFIGTNYSGTKNGVVLSTGLRVDSISNTFMDVTTGITVGASCTDCFLANNRYSGTTTNISDSGTNTRSVDLSSTSRMTSKGPGNMLFRMEGATSSSLQLYDAGGAADAKSIGLFADEQTMLVRCWNDNDTQKTELARFAIGRVSVGGTLNSEPLSTNTGVFANRITVTGTATGTSPLVSVDGSDTNINLRLSGKGSGALSFGTHSAIGAETLTGFITILDSGGTTRKIAVVS